MQLHILMLWNYHCYACLSCYFIFSFFFSLIYIGLETLGKGSFLGQCYFITHLAFILTGWGAAPMMYGNIFISMQSYIYIYISLSCGCRWTLYIMWSHVFICSLFHVLYFILFLFFFSSLQSSYSVLGGIYLFDGMSTTSFIYFNMFFYFLLCVFFFYLWSYVAYILFLFLLFFCFFFLLYISICMCVILRIIWMYVSN